MVKKVNKIRRFFVFRFIMAPYILGVLKDDDILPILKEMSRWTSNSNPDLGNCHCEPPAYRASGPEGEAKQSLVFNEIATHLSRTILSSGLIMNLTWFMVRCSQ
jgi:hypothetical protein